MPNEARSKDLVAAVTKLATESAPIVSSELVRAEWRSLGIDAGERTQHPGATYNGASFQAAYNKACSEGSLLKWQRAESDHVGWSLSAPRMGVIALREHARELGWSPHPAHRRSGDLVKGGVEMAEKIAKRLAATLKRGPRWATTELTFEEPAEGDAYGYVTVFVVDDRLEFGVWLDRTAALDEADVPILCAAFGAHSDADGRALAAIAESENVRRQSYEDGQDERTLGFGCKPVIDVPSNEARFLSSYRPAGEFDFEETVEQFRAFWDVWSDRVASILEHLTRPRTVRADWKGRALRGLVGELTVLARPGMAKARWVGMENGAHDIERGRLLIEVKTRTGDSATLSRQQIESHASDLYFIALVDLPSEAQLVLRRGDDKDPDVHAIVEKHREDIGAYLTRRGFGVAVDEQLLAAVSKAIRLSARAVTFHRIVPPPGFAPALGALEAFGRVADLSIDCGPEWFVPAKLPR
jgi:hypothetical protein